MIKTKAIIKVKENKRNYLFLFKMNITLFKILVVRKKLNN